MMYKIIKNNMELWNLIKILPLLNLFGYIFLRSLEKMHIFTTSNLSPNREPSLLTQKYFIREVIFDLLNVQNYIILFIK
jgi:hypothetical protein